MREIARIADLEIEQMESFPPDENPFQHDAFHMGVHLGKNVIAMMANHDTETMYYLILVHMPTGKRIRITLPEGRDYPRITRDDMKKEKS